MSRATALGNLITGVVIAGAMCLLVPMAHAQDRASISGRVYDVETGQGIPGVTVKVHSLYAPPQERFSESRPTGADGAYAVYDVGPGLASLQTSWRDPMPAGTNRPWVPTTFHVFVEPGQSREGVDIPVKRIRRDVVISGQVVDQEGKPVVGARVWAHRGYMSRDISGCQSEAEGRFELGGVEPGDWFWVQAVGADSKDLRSAPQRVELTSAGISGMTLTLYQTASVSLSVVDVNGSPVNPREGLVFFTSKEGPCAASGPGWRPSTWVDEEPSASDVVVEGLLPGTYSLLYCGRSLGELTVLPGQELRGHQVVDPLTPPVDYKTISGTVVNESGESMGLGFWIYAYSRQDTTYRAVKTDEAGAFAIPFLRPGITYLIRAEDSRYKALAENVSAETPEVRLQVAPKPQPPAPSAQPPSSATQPSDVAARPTSLTGRVVDRKTGQPIREFMMNSENSGPSFISALRVFREGIPDYLESRPPMTILDDQGRFQVPGGYPNTVLVSAAGYGLARKEFSEAERAGTADLVVELEPEARLRCTVVNEQGDPVPDAWIGIRSTVAPIQQNRRPEMKLGYTGTDGVAEIGGLTAAAFPFCVYTKGYAIELCTSPSLTPGETTGMTIVMHEPCTVEGRVTQGGEPVLNRRVEISYATLYANTETDGDGVFRFESLPAGDATVEVAGHDQDNKTVQKLTYTRPLTATPGVVKADFNLPPGTCAIEGDIPGSEGYRHYWNGVQCTGVVDQNVTVRGISEPYNEGRFYLDGLPATSYEVIARLHTSHEGVRVEKRREMQLVLESGQTYYPSIEFAGGGSVSGSVDGEYYSTWVILCSVEQASALVQDPGSRSTADWKMRQITVYRRDARQFRFENVPAGEYVLLLRRWVNEEESWALPPTPVTVIEGQDTKVELSLPQE